MHDFDMKLAELAKSCDMFVVDRAARDDNCSLLAALLKRRQVVKPEAVD